MIPTSQHPTSQRRGGSGSDLEDRLRGLILSNAKEKASEAGTQPPISSYIPPHMSAAPPVEQQQYLTGSFPRPPTSSSFPSPMVGFHTATQDPPSLRPQSGLEDSFSIPRQPPQSGRKRLNQAQRRQMNSQLSAPLDGEDTGAQISRGYNPNRGNSQQGFASSEPSRSSHMNYNQKYSQQQQQYSPHFANQSPSQYSYQLPHSQVYRQPPMNYNLPGHVPGYGQQHAQASNQTQQYQTPNQQGPGAPFSRPLPSNRQLYQPNQYGGQGRGRQFIPNPEEIANQSSYLATLVQDCVPSLGIDVEEEAKQENFRGVVEKACREAIMKYEEEELGNSTFDISSVALKCFGSTSSGFATRASDMDLALLTPLSNPPADSPESPIPRLLERTLLDLGYGARLLTRTRVPIIKLCQKPTPKLLQGLREARTKWENGFITDPEEEDEETVEVDLNHTKDVQPPKRTEKSVDGPELSAADVTSHNSGPAEDHLAKLKQKGGQSLSEYFNIAKRQLRKVGGRDISAGSPPLSIAECNLLNDVCRAFVFGLSSEAMVRRLRIRPNISPLFDSSLPPVQRSLNGLWSQIEGERLAMAFENRPLEEASEKQEQECLRLVEEWGSLQIQMSRLAEPLVYNRQLHMAAEKLKSFSSLQLVLLQQIQHEDPFYYQKRAQKIYDDLKSRDQHTADSITPIVISHYIAGISNPQIRKEMQDSSYSNCNLRDVTMQHRILQLAIDYEHALNHSLYDDLDRPIVEEYIIFLRNQPHQNLAEPALVAKIRTLPDPTVMSLNKPRDRYKDELEFPKTDVGIQCDINFAAYLALHNTLLLRCYSHSDSRVKPLVLFIKHWAKVRGINTPYRGSLSSYGYVLMVLHYLVNVAQPFVCPNLQLLHKDPSSHLSPAEIDSRTTCMGRDIRFWRNEAEIISLACRGMLNHNHDSVGTLLRGFFEYFAQGGQMSTVHGRGFDWGREVLSLRTQGGIISKTEKGWVGAKTVVETVTVAAPATALNHAQPKESGHTEHNVAQNSESEAKSTKPVVKTVEETKEIRHRYLFAIEDPFELDHNVARTVTHNGIVSIRDEFRRAWHLIRNIGRPGQSEGLLDPVNTGSESQPGLHELLDLIHGNERADTKTSA